jgi:type IV secretion system protein VirD4
MLRCGSPISLILSERSTPRMMTNAEPPLISRDAPMTMDDVLAGLRAFVQSNGPIGMALWLLGASLTILALAYIALVQIRRRKRVFADRRPNRPYRRTQPTLRVRAITLGRAWIQRLGTAWLALLQWIEPRLRALVHWIEPRWRRLDAFIRSLSPRMLLLFVLWVIYILWTGSGVLVGGAAYRPAANLVAAPPSFFINFWGCAAGLAFAAIVANVLRWRNGKRLIFGCIAFAMMLGRLTGASYLLFYLPISRELLFIAVPFTLLIGGMTAISVTFFVALSLFTAFVAVPVLLFKLILSFDHSLRIYRYQAQGLAGYIVRFFHWLRNEPLPASPPDDSKGARFATMPEITGLYSRAPESMAFGHIGNPLFLKTEKHILIQASTRSGKGVALIIPHLLRYPGSAFVLDPKAENAKATGRRRAQLNGQVHYLDPFGISGKPQSRFNPLSRFTPANMETESKALAAALVLGERDHWTAAAQQLLAALILYVYSAPDIPADKKDLVTVRRLLLGAMKMTLRAMAESEAAEGLLAALAQSFIDTPEKEFGSILSTAQRESEILDNPYIAACLSAAGKGKEVSFADWHKGTMTAFLCLSAPKFPVFNRWLRIVLTAALDEMTDRLQPPERPVCFMLDELATLGHLAVVENAIGLAAGYGVQLVSVFQDVAQMRDLYKGRWASFIGNAGVRALFNLDDYDTAHYWSQFMGGHLVETRSHQEDVYGLSGGSNVGEQMRPLLSPDEIMRLFAANKMLVLPQGAHPVVSDRVPYFKDASLAGLWDDPRVASQGTKPGKDSELKIAGVPAAEWLNLQSLRKKL